MHSFILCPPQGMPDFLSTISATPRILSLARIYALKCWKQYDHFVAEARSLTVSNIIPLMQIFGYFFSRRESRFQNLLPARGCGFFLEDNISVTACMWQSELLLSVCLANKDLIESPLKSVGRILLPQIRHWIAPTRSLNITYVLNAF